MTSETKFRLALTFLLLSLALLVVKNVFGDEPAVKLEVSPRVYSVMPYAKNTFRVKWQIRKDSNNREYSVSYLCESGEERLSSRGMNGENEPYTFPEWYPNINTGGSCVFEVCVYRNDKSRKCVNQQVYGG